jgi:hypothetical protein
MVNTVRQSQAPLNYARTMRMDNVTCQTSIDAGVIAPIVHAPLLRGESATGRIIISAELAEMPKPIKNAVIGRAQSWLVPRPALPQFIGLDEYTHAWQGKTPTALGSTPVAPSLFATVGTGAIAAAEASELFKTMGLALQASTAINTDLIDSYNLICNFRLFAHSSKATRYDYYSENATTSLELKPAFWPRNRMHNVVPDYESELVKGSLELDVTAGSIPVTGIATDLNTADGVVNETDNNGVTYTNYGHVATTVVGGGNQDVLFIEDDGSNSPNIYANMAAQTIATSLADIDKARTTQAFAKAQAAMAGNNFSGFNNDDVIVAELMQGYAVPQEMFNRPWLLDNKVGVFGLTERHATDAANLDDSVSTGGLQLALSINVPRQEYGGLILTTFEVMPERLYERQSDEWLYCTTRDDMPNNLADSLRTEPVDTVLNRRVDVAHTTPGGTYGYEPMNAKWKREFTRLGGEFQSLTPGAHATAARSAIWQTEISDPAFTSDHYLCPHPFPHDVFSVPGNNICEVQALQRITIAGNTVYGDDLVEDNDEFTDTLAQQP